MRAVSAAWLLVLAMLDERSTTGSDEVEAVEAMRETTGEARRELALLPAWLSRRNRHLGSLTLI